MRVKVLCKGRTHVLDDADLMIVEDEKGDPVSLAYALGLAGAFVVSCIDDPVKFNQELKRIGLNRTIIAVDASTKLKSDHQLSPV